MPETNQRFKKTEALAHSSHAAAKRTKNKWTKDLGITGDESKDDHRIRIRRRGENFLTVKYVRLEKKASLPIPEDDKVLDTGQLPRVPKKAARKK